MVLVRYRMATFRFRRVFASKCPVKRIEKRCIEHSARSCYSCCCCMPLTYARPPYCFDSIPFIFPPRLISLLPYLSSCRYPYAGERCSELGVPFWFFVIQVICLVFSNLAMVPGVWLCISMQLPVLAALLSSSAVSSAIYHLCDTDVYCLGGLSFKSLQVNYTRRTRM